MWNYSTVTPLERPAELAGKEVFTDAEAVQFERQALKTVNKDRRDNSEKTRIVNGTTESDDLARAYNEFWWDRGTRIVGTKHTSLV